MAKSQAGWKLTESEVLKPKLEEDAAGIEKIFQMQMKAAKVEVICNMQREADSSAGLSAIAKSEGGSLKKQRRRMK
jgi:hypothetical protein